MAHFLISGGRRLAPVFAASVLALVLSGCQTTAQQPAPAAASKPAPAPEKITSRFDDGTYGFMLSSVPTIPGAKPLRTVTTRQAFEGSGVYYFNDAQESNFRFAGKDAQGRYTVKETYAKGQPHGFTLGTSLTPVVRNGRTVSIENPSWLTEEKDGSVTLTANTSGAPLSVRVKLWAFDVSGEYVYKYLRTRLNYPTSTAETTTARFPKGSIAYMPQIFMPEDQFVVLRPNAFTGAGSVEGFVRNFSRDIPYCLSYLAREGYVPYGVSFDAKLLSAGSAQTTYKTVTETKWVKGKNGKKVKKTVTKKVPVVREAAIPETGSVNLMPVKTGTVFCERTSTTPAATGTYRMMTLNGTRGLAMQFPATVRAPDTGIFELSRNAVSLALVEMNKNGTTSVVPGYRIVANQPVTDFQYRFNETAATAVRQAIAEAKKSAAPAK